MGGLRNAPPLGRNSKGSAKSGFDELDSMFDDDPKPDKSKPKRKGTKKVRPCDTFVSIMLSTL